MQYMYPLGKILLVSRLYRRVLDCILNDFSFGCVCVLPSPIDYKFHEVILLPKFTSFICYLHDNHSVLKENEYNLSG